MPTNNDGRSGHNREKGVIAMNAKRITVCTFLISLAMILVGCAGNMPEPQRYYDLDSHWGKSFETAKKNQILNPKAGKEEAPVTGLDGQAAATAMDEYRKGYAGPPEQRVYNLNLDIGGIGGQ
jgi:hypothetical protein